MISSPFLFLNRLNLENPFQLYSQIIRDNPPIIIISALKPDYNTKTNGEWIRVNEDV
jgi:hypothetical protein